MRCIILPAVEIRATGTNLALLSWETTHQIVFIRLGIILENRSKHTKIRFYEVPSISVYDHHFRIRASPDAVIPGTLYIYR